MADVVRTDCIECGMAVYHRMDGKDMHVCMPRGDAIIWRHDREGHFIIYLDRHVTASCHPWNELDSSIEKMEKV